MSSKIEIPAPMIGGVVTSAILEVLIYPVIFVVWRRRSLWSAMAMLAELRIPDKPRHRRSAGIRARVARSCWYQRRGSSAGASAREILEKNLGIQIKAFAYPYGLHNQTVRDVVKQAGLKPLLLFTASESRTGPIRW